MKPAKEDAGRILERVKRFVLSLSYDELIIYVYTHFEHYTINSEIRDEYLARRVPLARSMTLAGKVSLSKGAQIAGLSASEFRRLVQ
jgi:predicted HTH domain antitoxin